MKRTIRWLPALVALLTLQGCTIFYDTHYSDDHIEVKEYGLLGNPIHDWAPRRGPYGLIPIMREVRIKQ